MKLSHLTWTLLLVFAIGGCQSEQGAQESGGESQYQEKETGSVPQGPLFTLLDSSETGIHFVNTLEDDPMTNRNNLSFPHYYNGAGIAVGDINNDGLPDVFFVANEGKNRLFLNQGDMRFRDITENAGVNPSNKRWSTGAVMADVNGDGLLDIYVCQAGYGLFEDRSKRENLLLINNGDLTFSEKAEEYGIDNANESISAAFFDYDKDGDLDLYVLNESKYAMIIYQKVFDDLQKPGRLEAASGTLYRNDGGNFTDVTEEAGVLRYGFGLGLVVSDINDDGWPDIYVSNDYSVPDFMYINNGDGTFTDEINERTRQVPYFGMGADIADYNNDGLVDIASVDMAANDHIRDKTLMASMDVEGFNYFVSELGYQYQYMFNAFQLNNGNGTFSNIAGLAGVLRTEWSWAALLADLNNNGWKDYFVSNGYRRYTRDNDFRREMEKVRKRNGGSVPPHLRDEMYNKIPEIQSKNLVFRNNKDLTFTDVSDEWGLGEMSYSNGAVYADLDGDGDLDMLVNNIDHPSFVFRNNAREQERGNYLQFEFGQNTPDALAYTSKVWVFHEDQKQVQEFQPTRGYAGSVQPLLHFGLGEVEQVDRVVVEWSNGKLAEYLDVSANQRMTLEIKDATEKDIAVEVNFDQKYFEELDIEEYGINFRHRENAFNDFEKEILLPHRQSTLGPQLAVGDVNGNGLSDFYIGGAKGQPGALFQQQASGKFEKFEFQPPWRADFQKEDLDALFFDPDGNGRQDLFVVSGGGGEFDPGDAGLYDRLYINASQEERNVFLKVRAFDSLLTAGHVASAGDLDGDGIDELFIGGAAVPGNYPYPERSYILKNQDNFFKDITDEVAPELKKPGMVKDAFWTDLNGDQNEDLVIVGEWMPIRIFINDGNGKLEEQSSDWGLDDTEGWHYSIAAADVDNDGRQDLVVGNVGLNTKFSASKKKPFHIFANDFDQNGVVDIVLSKEYKGKLVPARGRECSSDQMPFIKDKFETYQDFATADLEDIYGDDRLSEALHLQVKNFASSVYLNKEDGFHKIDLPNLAQIAPVKGIVTTDINSDGNVDLIIAGNMHETEVETPRYDAGNGLLLLGNGDGTFEPVPPHESGLFAPRNAKDLALLNGPGGSQLLLVANNNDRPQLFRVKESEMVGAAPGN